MRIPIDEPPGRMFDSKEIERHTKLYKGSTWAYYGTRTLRLNDTRSRWKKWWEGPPYRTTIEVPQWYDAGEFLGKIYPPGVTRTHEMCIQFQNGIYECTKDGWWDSRLENAPIAKLLNPGIPITLPPTAPPVEEDEDPTLPGGRRRSSVKKHTRRTKRKRGHTKRR